MAAQRKKRAEDENKEVLSEEGEEDFEEAMRKVASVVHARKQYELPNQQIVVNIPEVVDDFLRNFFRRTGLSRTLTVFEAEWADRLLRTSLITATSKAGVSFMPDALTHREFLQSQLDTVLSESEILRQEVLVAGERMMRMQRERDFHRLQYRQISRDKNKLTEDIKQLKKHLESYESALRQLGDSYHMAMRQKMLISLKKDKIQNTPESRVKQENLQLKKEASIRRYSSQDKPSAKGPMKRLPKDTELPFCSRKAPAQVECQRWKKPISFSLSCSIRAHKLPISCISLHPRKPILASASDDRSWRLWLLPANSEKVGQVVMTGEGHSDWLSSCSFHPDGSKLATTSGDATVRLWDFSLGCSVLTLSGHSHPTWGCSFRSCGHFLASCSADRTTKLWDLSSRQCLITLRRHTASVNSVCFLPSSNLLLTCSADKTLALWDARLGICTAAFHGHLHSCNHAAVSRACDIIASCDTKGVINLWDVRKPASAVATIDAGPLGTNQVAFSPSGKMLVAACSDGLVRLVETCSCSVTSLLRHSESVQSVICGHMEETVISAGSDGLINVWSLQNEE